MKFMTQAFICNHNHDNVYGIDKTIFFNHPSFTFFALYTYYLVDVIFTPFTDQINFQRSIPPSLGPYQFEKSLNHTLIYTTNSKQSIHCYTHPMQCIL